MRTIWKKGISRVATIAIVAVVLVVGVAGAYLAFNRAGGPSVTSSPSTSKVTVILPQGVGANTSLNFEPVEITIVVDVNNTVVWMDQDASASHTVAALSVPPGAVKFDSGTSKLLQQGSTFAVTLTVAGTYTYDCSLHPAWMKGTIIVKA